MNKRVLKVAVVTMAVAAALPGCTRMRNNQGYVADEQLTSAIQAGVDNRESVLKTLGRPSITSQFDDREWYYVSRNTAQLAFLTPKATEQQILIVTFDPNGTVSKVEKRGLEQVVSVTPSDDKTPTLGRDSGLLEDLFGNIGRFGSAPAAGGPPQ